MKQRFLIFATLLFLICFVNTSFALDMEYYTYNGFGPVVTAYQKIALIFSDSRYHALFFSIIALGIMFGAVVPYFTAKSGRFSPFSWLLPTLAGVIFYFSLIIPTGTLHIYDEVKNQYQPVGGVPNGIILIGGFLNLIERGLIDVVSVSGDPVGYQAQAGGAGFDMLRNLHAKGVTFTDQYLHQSVKNYIQDCVFFELNRPGAGLTINQFSSAPDFLLLFDVAENPAIFTVFYEDATPEGTTLNCTQANTAIKAELLNPAQYEGSIASRCAESGFDPTIAAEFNACQETFENIVAWFEGLNYPIEQIFRQKAIAESFYKVVLSSSPDTAVQILGARDTGTSMMSSGIIANDWIPVIKGVTTAIAVGILPIIVLFIPTPIFFRALGIMLAFFFWLTAWGVTDAIAHQFALDYANTTFEEIRRYQLGITAISSFGTSSLKALAAFGAIRWSGITLATVLTIHMIKISGHALAQLSSQQTGTAKNSGERVGEVTKPEGAASTLNALENAPPVMANAEKFGFNAIADSKTNTRAKGVGSGSGFGTPSNAFATGETMSQVESGSAEGTRKVARSDGNGNVRAMSSEMATNRTGKSLGDGRGHKTQGSAWGMTNAEYGKFKSSGSVVTDDLAKKMTKNGIAGGVSGMHITKSAVDANTGKLTQISAEGPVTKENLGALQSIARASGQGSAVDGLKPGMIARYSVNTQTGVGTFQATDSTSVSSNDNFRRDIGAGGLTVQTETGESIHFESGSIVGDGNQFTVKGTTQNGEHMSMSGTGISGFLSGQNGVSEFDRMNNNGGRVFARNKAGDISQMGLNVSNGKIETGLPGDQTMNPQQLHQFADHLETQGPQTSEAVSAIRGIAASGQSARVSSSQATLNGNYTAVSVGAGAQAQSYNFQSSRSGRSTTQEDTTTSSFNRGLTVGSGTAMQSSLSGDPSLFNSISDPNITMGEYNARVSTIAASLSSDMSRLRNESGASSGQTSMVTGARSPLPFIVATGTLGKTSEEASQTNLLTSAYDQRIRSASLSAQQQNMNPEETANHISTEVGKLTKSLYDGGRSLSGTNFGSDVLPQEGLKVGKVLAENAGKIRDSFAGVRHPEEDIHPKLEFPSSSKIDPELRKKALGDLDEK